MWRSIYRMLASPGASWTRWLSQILSYRVLGMSVLMFTAAVEGFGCRAYEHEGAGGCKPLLKAFRPPHVFAPAARVRRRRRTPLRPRGRRPIMLSLLGFSRLYAAVPGGTKSATGGYPWERISGGAPMRILTAKSLMIAGSLVGAALL